MENPFNRCCAKEIKRIWNNKSPMNIIRYEGTCPECGHYIGITQTPKEEADKFLRKHSLIFSDN